MDDLTKTCKNTSCGRHNCCEFGNNLKPESFSGTVEMMHGFVRSKTNDKCKREGCAVFEVHRSDGKYLHFSLPDDGSIQFRDIINLEIRFRNSNSYLVVGGMNYTLNDLDKLFLEQYKSKIKTFANAQLATEYLKQNLFDFARQLD